MNPDDCPDIKIEFDPDSALVVPFDGAVHTALDPREQTTPPKSPRGTPEELRFAALRKAAQARMLVIREEHRGRADFTLGLDTMNAARLALSLESNGFRVLVELQADKEEDVSIAALARRLDTTRQSIHRTIDTALKAGITIPARFTKRKKR